MQNLLTLNSTHRRFRNIIGESPIADLRHIYWVDAEANQVFRMHLHTKTIDRFNVEIPVTAIAFTSTGSFLLASKTGIYLTDSRFQLLRFICNPVSKMADVRINDAVVSPNGDLWFGTMNESEFEQPDGVIYVMRHNLGDVHLFDTGFSVANGIAFSPDGRYVYISNMFQGQVLRYLIDDSGMGYTEKYVFVQLQDDASLPDGLTVDADGNLYVCHWNGQRITVYSPQGKCIDRIDLPAMHVTRCTFYGESYSTLAVTSGSYECDLQAMAKYPDSGCLFLLNGQRQGVPDYKYKLL